MPRAVRRKGVGEMNTFRYSPQQVDRYVVNVGAVDELVARYLDATVRDQGTGNWLQAPQAMLRAYSNDPEFYGDEEYRQGNCIKVWTQEAQDKYTDPSNKYAGRADTYSVGAVYDCDGDLALKRIMMNVVVSTHNYGHGSMDYVGFVNKADNPDRKGEEYDGLGFSNSEFRIERWRLYYRGGEDNG